MKVKISNRKHNITQKNYTLEKYLLVLHKFKATRQTRIFFLIGFHKFKVFFTQPKPENLKWPGNNKLCFRLQHT